MTEHSIQISALEQQLVCDAFNGDKVAFGKLVQRYHAPVFSACARYLNGEDARDAAQEVFIKAFVHRSRFTPERAVLPWLLTIGRNLCIDRLRKSRGEMAMAPEMEPPSTEASAEEQLAARQSLEIVRQQMDQLPEGQREALVLHHVEGLAYREVSDVLGIPIGTVMTWLHRGRKSLLHALKRSE